MSEFEKWLKGPHWTSDPTDFARIAWNAALEAAAKTLDEMAKGNYEEGSPQHFDAYLCGEHAWIIRALKHPPEQSNES